MKHSARYLTTPRRVALATAGLLCVAFALPTANAVLRSGDPAGTASPGTAVGATSTEAPAPSAPASTTRSASAGDGGLRGLVGGGRRANPVATPPAATATYYVDCTAGDDGAAGTSGRPWRTPARVRRTTFAGGTSLALRRGCTWNDTLDVQGPTSPTSAGVRVGAYGTGAAPVLSGAGLRVPSVVSLLGTGVSLSDVTVTDAEQYGVQLFGAGGTLHGVTVTRSGIAVRILGAGALVDHVTATDLHMIVNTPGGQDDYGAVGYDVEADGARIVASTCTRCRAPSADWGYDGGFVEIWNHGDDLVVSGCTATDTEGFLEIGGDAQGSSAAHVRILDNVMNEVHGGFFVHGGDSFSLHTSDVVISGNRLTNRLPASNGVLAGDLQSVEIINNVIIAAQPFAFSVPAAHSGNTYYLPGASSLGFPLGAAEVVRLLAQAP